MGDLVHRIRAHLGMAQEAASGIREGEEDSWGRVPLGALEADHGHRIWLADLAEGILVFHHVEAAWLRRYEDEGMQYALVRRLALGTIPV